MSMWRSCGLTDGVGAGWGDPAESERKLNRGENKQVSSLMTICSISMPAIYMTILDPETEEENTTA